MCNFGFGRFCLLTLVIACCWAVKTPETTGVKPTATRGIVIDAGSGGSRLHVYSWKPRVFTSAPPKLSYPESTEKWTARIGPGVASFANNLDGLYNHLKPLLDFAKKTLASESGDLSDYPIYFYATGGVRLLNTPSRDALINRVRDLFENETFCPFFFHRHFARVISGEEEAIFSWAATNFLMGTLLPASEGEGIVQFVNTTYGTVDLGGASTQIAYFLPSQDILEGLFKFQIGNQKIWNVYTKSYLSFGVVAARQRHTRHIVNTYLNSLPEGSYDKSGKKNNDLRVLNPCFYAGYSEEVRDSSGKIRVTVHGPELSDRRALKDCMKSVQPLMEMQHNGFCEEVYHGDCSIAGAYMPPLPNGVHGRFIGTSSLTLPWRFLQLPPTASLEEIRAKASNICQMNFDNIMFYYQVNFSGDSAGSVVDNLPYFCFLSSYVLVLLEDGYRFDSNQTLTVREQVNGNRMGWALGAILYEINEYPWALEEPHHQQGTPGLGGGEDGSGPGAFGWWPLLLATLGGFALGSIAAVMVYKEVTQHPYQRVPQGEEAEGEAFDSIRRANTVEMLRRRPAGVEGASGGAGGDGGSAYSTGSTVGVLRYEGARYEGGRYDSGDRGIIPSSSGAGTPLNSSSGGAGPTRYGTDNL